MPQRYGVHRSRINASALVALRIEAGLSQSGLGRRAGVSRTHVSRLESGQRCYPAPTITEALAEALNVPMNALILADPDPSRDASRL